MELWLGVVVAAAFLKTAYESLQKHLAGEFGGLQLSYVTSVLGLAFLAPVGAWIAMTTELALSAPVIAVVLLSGAANIAAIYAFLTALELEQLSIVAPLVQLSPILVAVSEPVVLATPFEAAFVGGAALAIVGGFVLLADGRSPAPPVDVSSRAVVLAVAAAGCFAVASLSNRYVTTRIPPLFYTFLVYLLMSLGFAAILAIRRSRVPATDLLRVELFTLGGLTSLRTSVTYYAFSLAAASRVTVGLQLSIVFSVLAGGVLFGEGDLPRKLLGAALILLGIAFVV